MTKNTIGILGVSGRVGRAAVKTLLPLREYKLILGSRNQEKTRKVFPELETGVDCRPVDIYNKDLLEDFCRRCDLVVNCAGPSRQILDRVAAAAIEQGAHYVDVSGDERLYKQLMKRNREIKEKKLSVIISAGVYPGLSELFPAYVAEKYFEDLDLLELFFAGQGEFSLNAAYDIVCSIQDNTGLGMTYCENGEAKKITTAFHSSYLLPRPAGKLDTYPILNQEFKQLANRYNIKSAYFYNTYPNKSVLNKFVMIKALEQYKTEEQKRTSARILAEQYGGEKKETKDFTMFHLSAKGSKNGKPMQLDANVLFQNDWNTLSGIIAANVARLIIEGQRDPGCFFAAEGVNAANLMKALPGQDRTYIFKVRKKLNYEQE